MRRKKPKVGDVIQIALPTGWFAYGRVLRDASVGVYAQFSEEPGMPPLGSRDYQFVVGIYSDVPGSSECPVVGHDPSESSDDDWPPPACIEDVISGRVELYHQGKARPATPEECDGLERVAAWDLHHIVDRIMGMNVGSGLYRAPRESK